MGRAYFSGILNYRPCALSTKPMRHQLSPLSNRLGPSPIVLIDLFLLPYGTRLCRNIWPSEEYKFTTAFGRLPASWQRFPTTSIIPRPMGFHVWIWTWGSMATITTSAEMKSQRPTHPNYFFLIYDSWEYAYMLIDCICHLSSNVFELNKKEAIIIII